VWDVLRVKERHECVDVEQIRTRGFYAVPQLPSTTRPDTADFVVAGCSLGWKTTLSSLIGPFDGPFAVRIGPAFTPGQAVRD
jgi:hypothetical protein